jgi:hypothetical protein
MNDNIPIIPPLTPEQKDARDNPPDSNPVVARCGECKRDVKAMEHYCCQNQYCPLKARLTF